MKLQRHLDLDVETNDERNSFTVTITEPESGVAWTSKELFFEPDEYPDAEQTVYAEIHSWIGVWFDVMDEMREIDKESEN